MAPVDHVEGRRTGRGAPDPGRDGQVGAGEDGGGRWQALLDHDRPRVPNRIVVRPIRREAVMAEAAVVEAVMPVLVNRVEPVPTMNGPPHLVKAGAVKAVVAVMRGSRGKVTMACAGRRRDGGRIRQGERGQEQRGKQASRRPSQYSTSPASSRTR